MTACRSPVSRRRSRSRPDRGPDLPGARRRGRGRRRGRRQSLHRTGTRSTPRCPTSAITVFGPPPTSGTRDAFVELVMHDGCEDVPGDRRRSRATARTRSARACAGRPLHRGRRERQPDRPAPRGRTPNALGIFGYSFLYENQRHAEGRRRQRRRAELRDDRRRLLSGRAPALLLRQERAPRRHPRPGGVRRRVRLRRGPRSGRLSRRARPDPALRRPSAQTVQDAVTEGGALRPLRAADGCRDTEIAPAPVSTVAGDRHGRAQATDRWRDRICCFLPIIVVLAGGLLRRPHVRRALRRGARTRPSIPVPSITAPSSPSGSAFRPLVLVLLWLLFQSRSIDRLLVASLPAPMTDGASPAQLSLYLSEIKNVAAGRIFGEPAPKSPPPPSAMSAGRHRPLGDGGGRRWRRDGAGAVRRPVAPGAPLPRPHRASSATLSRSDDLLPRSSPS